MQFTLVGMMERLELCYILLVNEWEVSTSPLNLTSVWTSDIIKIVKKYINKGEIKMVKLRNCNENSARNLNCVEIGEVELYFSYETCVAFWTPKTGLVVSENTVS